jgi:microcystin-dependent protein
VSTEPFLGQLMVVTFTFAPKGWAMCNGQLLPINQNQALFSLLGTTFGGDGRVNFALPDLRGRVPIHAGGGYTLGQRGGEETHTLILSELASHNHPLIASTNTASQASPANAYPASNGTSAFGSQPTGALATAVSSIGGGQAHENRPPYLVLNVVIALQGIFPSQN